MQKCAKLGEKRCVFSHVHKFWKGHGGKIKEKMQKKMCIRVFFRTWKYVLKVYFESPFTRMICSLKYKDWHVPAAIPHIIKRLIPNSLMAVYKSSVKFQL